MGEVPGCNSIPKSTTLCGGSPGSYAMHPGSSAYAMHPGSTKMYRTLKEYYWWSRMKREVVEYVSKCFICQQVKVER